MDKEPADTVRRFFIEPGDAGRGLAAAFRNGRESRKGEARQGISRISEPLSFRQDAALITQNIDNLHQMSGITASDIVELHGNTTYALCLDCAKRYDLSWVREKFNVSGERAPDCGCGGHIKTATVWFGPQIPAEAMQRAEELTGSCDLFLAVGSSLMVWPAAGFPLMAKRNCAALVIINREPTEFDDIADLVVRNDIGDALSPFIER